MLFRNDETKEEREAREEIFGSKLLVSADEALTMDVDRPPTSTQNDPFIPPKHGLSTQEPREIPQTSPAPVQPTPAQSSAAPVKMFGRGANLGTNFSNAAESSADAPTVPLAPTTSSTAPPLEPPLSSLPFIRTAPAPTAPASGRPTPPATAMPTVWQGAVVDEDEDEEMPEINIESDSE
jgi:hypothetical protein